MSYLNNTIVDVEEFLTTLEKNRQDTPPDDMIEEAFHCFDRDGDGLISPEELHHVMDCLGEQMSADDITEMIKEADIDGDGSINMKG